MFIATLVITAKTLKQSKCYSVGQQINKLWYIHTMENYSVINGMHYSYMQQYGQLSSGFFYMEEVRLKMVYII